MLRDSPIRERLTRQDGWSLVELLVVILILGLVLGAVIKLSVTGQKAGARDRERNITVERGNAFLYRMTTELRQATMIHLSDTSCPKTTSAPANCIDFNLESRVVVARDPTTGAVTSVTRPARRVRFNCSSGACFRAVSTNVATAPSGTVQQQFVSNVKNASVTAAGGALPPIFDYKAWDATAVPAGWTSKTLQFSSANITLPPPNWVNVTLVAARTGARRTGLGGNIDFQDAADFKNMNFEATACSPSSAVQGGGC